MFTRFTAAATLGCLMLAGSPSLLIADTTNPGQETYHDKSLAVPNEHFPAEWFWARNEAQWEKVNALVGTKATEFKVGEWHNPGTVAKNSMKEFAGKPLLIDFWGTWCGPCLAAAPKISELAEKYADDIRIVAICNTRRGETMAETADRVGMKIPTAMDLDDKTRDAYGVQWWPYYVLVDSNGVVRAAGISSAHVEDAMKKLIELDKAAKTESASIPATPLQTAVIAAKAEWLEGNARQREVLDAMHGKPAPSLTVENWMNAPEMTLASLKGQIVVLDFWATWCGPCIASIPKNNEIAEKYKDRGVVFIGVCHPRGVEKMSEVVSEKGIRFPVAADTSGSTNEAFGVNSYPDYYIIDRMGRIVVADARNDKVEEILDAILAHESNN